MSYKIIDTFLKSLSLDIKKHENRWTRGMSGEDLNFFFLV
jgi:hypothetical protein